MSKEDEIREILDRAAVEISANQSNPRAWQSWMIYLLRRLDEETKKQSTAYQGSFNDMLTALQDGIRNRMRTGGW